VVDSGGMKKDQSPKPSGPPVAHAAVETSAEGLHRRLSSRQLTMIAIGGAIGVGLFLGSSVTIRLAGPGVIVSYCIGAVIALILAYALAEMAVVHPQTGSFGIYAELYLNHWAGFAVRCTYAVVQIIAIGAEVTAVAIYFGYWFPAIPQWLWIAVVSAALISLNGLQVSLFGEIEYWFAFIKIAAIVVFIAIGFLLITGIGPWTALGVRNLTTGGFLPQGWTGVWLALTLAITSYMGVEVIAVTAGEAENPRESIPRAMRTIVFRLIAFYILAITVILAISPWTHTGNGQVTGSPFVRAFAVVGIPYAATIMNLVVISAALSSANTNLYLSTRMVFSLSHDGYLPAVFRRVSNGGAPRRALAVAASGMGAAILLAIYAPANAFLLLYGTAVAGMFFVWIVVLLSHLKFRRSLTAEQLRSLPVRLPWYPLPTLLAIAALFAIALTTTQVDGLRYTLLSFAPFLVLITLAYVLTRTGKQRGSVLVRPISALEEEAE